MSAPLRVDSFGFLLRREYCVARILVVDDFKDGRDVMGMLLRHAGHVTFLAASGEDALRVLQSQSLDLVLLDVSMPRMNGFEVLTALREQSIAHPPILMMTAHKDEVMRARAVSLGASGFLIKGDVDVEDVLAQVNMHLPAAQS